MVIDFLTEGIVDEVVEIVEQELLQDYVASEDVHNIISLTQAEYDALPTKDASTLYVITG